MISSGFNTVLNLTSWKLYGLGLLVGSFISDLLSFPEAAFDESPMYLCWIALFPVSGLGMAGRKNAPLNLTMKRMPPR